PDVLSSSNVQPAGWLVENSSERPTGEIRTFLPSACRTSVVMSVHCHDPECAARFAPNAASTMILARGPNTSVRNGTPRLAGRYGEAMVWAARNAPRCVGAWVNGTNATGGMSVQALQVGPLGGDRVRRRLGAPGDVEDHALRRGVVRSRDDGAAHRHA